MLMLWIRIQNKQRTSDWKFSVCAYFSLSVLPFTQAPVHCLQLYIFCGLSQWISSVNQAKDIYSHNVHECQVVNWGYYSVQMWVAGVGGNCGEISTTFLQ